MFKEKEYRIGKLLLFKIPFLFIIITFQNSHHKVASASAQKEIISSSFISSSQIEIGELKLPESNSIAIAISILFPTHKITYFNFNKSLTYLFKLLPHFIFKGKNIYLLTYFSKAP